jgi:acyl carrier protein
VASIWEAVLAVPIGVDDDFFALGGQSLAAAQIAARVRDAFGVDLAVTAVFEHPTVAELARVVSGVTAG